MSLTAVIPLGTSNKRADFLKEQIMEGSRLFKDVRSVRVLLVAVVTCLLRTDNRCLQCLGTQHAEAAFGMTHAFTISPLFCEKRVTLCCYPSQYLSGSSREPPASALGELMVTIRASPPDQCPHRPLIARSSCSAPK